MELTDEEQLAQAIAMSLNEAATPAVTPPAAPPPAVTVGAASSSSSSAEQPPPTTTETTSAASSSASALATITAAPETALPETTPPSTNEAPPAPQPAEEPKPAKKPPPKDTRFSLVKPAEPISVNLLDSFVQRTLLPACLQVLDQLALSSPVPSSSPEAVAGPIASTGPVESSSEPSASSAGASSASAVSDAALRLTGRAPDSGAGVAAGAPAPTRLTSAELKQALVRVSELLITSLRRYDRQLRASAAEVASAQQPTSLSTVSSASVAGPSSTAVSLASVSAPQQTGEQSATESTGAAVSSETETAMDTSTAPASSTAQKPEDKAEEKWLELMVLKANDVRDQLLQQLVNDLLSLLTEIRVNSATAGFAGSGTSTSTSLSLPHLQSIDDNKRSAIF